MTRIAMWSGPRSISTALMRSFENRPDTSVIDEPFYAHYLHETGEDHPYANETIVSGETSWNKVAQYIIGDIPEGKRVWYQKHMAQHNLPGKDLDWIDNMNNILLIRHPAQVILSYLTKYEITSINQLGYPQQNTLFNMLIKGRGDTPIILDAEDVLAKPEGILLALCGRLNIAFYKEMLSWPAGGRESDGIWGKHWYDRVEMSTSFQPISKKNNILPPDMQGLYNDCMEYYQQLYQHRMKIE